MKKTLFTVAMMLIFTVVSAQTNPYIVKTRSAMKDTIQAAADSTGTQHKRMTDFVSMHFKFYSLCDWKPGMKFMVMPDKYDLIVRTFCDAETNKEVSSTTLREKIMEYKGHNETRDGHSRLNFECLDNHKKYYFQIPNGSFDDYCYGKLGVPTLAYLGDVDIARKELIGKTLYTKTKVYREDTSVDGDGYREIEVPKNMEVKVVKVGVGSRSFPVKIIVADSEGKEFYQTVAMSRTNSGMRDDEFIMDSLKHTFYGAFEMLDDIMAVDASNYTAYIGKTIHTKIKTRLLNETTKKQQSIPRMAEYMVESITKHKDEDMYTIKLKSTILGTFFYGEVSMDPKVEPSNKYFGNIFAPGSGKYIETTEAARTMIRSGHVSIGFNEDQVMMAAGEPDDIEPGKGGEYTWVFQRSNKKLLLVKFNGTRHVIGTSVRNGTITGSTATPKTGGKASTSKVAPTTPATSATKKDNWKDRNGTPL